MQGYIDHYILEPFYAIMCMLIAAWFSWTPHEWKKWTYNISSLYSGLFTKVDLATQAFIMIVLMVAYASNLPKFDEEPNVAITSRHIKPTMHHKIMGPPPQLCLHRSISRNLPSLNSLQATETCGKQWGPTAMPRWALTSHMSKMLKEETTHSTFYPILDLGAIPSWFAMYILYYCSNKGVHSCHEDSGH